MRLADRKGNIAFAIVQPLNPSLTVRRCFDIQNGLASSGIQPSVFTLKYVAIPTLFRANLSIAMLSVRHDINGYKNNE